MVGGARVSRSGELTAVERRMKKPSNVRRWLVGLAEPERDVDGVEQLRRLPDGVIAKAASRSLVFFGTAPSAFAI
jgi:hypothetical protein